MDRLDAAWTTFTKQKMSFSTVNITEPGYVFVWLSYDNNVGPAVYFDDLKVTHTKTNVIQYNEYYPFGLQMSSSWARDNSLRNDYLYNAGSELNMTNGWYETLFRGYDPALGRFLQIAPMALSYSGLSPYNYAFNDPAFWNDPTGADPIIMNGRLMNPRDVHGNRVWEGSELDFNTFADALSGFGGSEGISIGGMNVDDYLTNSSVDAYVWSAYANEYVSAREILAYDPTNQNVAYRQNAANALTSAIIKAATHNDRFNLFSFGGQLFDSGATIYGGVESGITVFRRADGAQKLNKAIGFGTQRQAAALRGTAGVVGKLAKGLGAFGYGLQVVSIGSKVLNGEQISTGDKVGFGISTFFVGAAWVAGTTILAPWVAGGALIYGGAELISYATTGESLETNIFGK
jgi:RHS repeat-associated protein